MSEVIDINSRLNGPDQSCVWTDEEGRKWFKYSVAYNVGDANFSFAIWALNAEDAEYRISELKKTALFEGQILGEIQ